MIYGRFFKCYKLLNNAILSVIFKVFSRYNNGREMPQIAFENSYFIGNLGCILMNSFRVNKNKVKRTKT